MVGAGDRFGFSLVLLLDDVVCCRNWAIRDNSCAWNAGGKTAAVGKEVMAGSDVTKGMARDWRMGTCCVGAAMWQGWLMWTHWQAYARSPCV